MTITPQWLDELRARISLSRVIGRTTRLTKAGHEFKACCPFHNEKSPSFTVNDSKGFYHCFGCGAHGDAIRWMTDQRGLSFMDAVKELAAEAGLEVPAPDPRAAKAAEQRDSLHDIMTAAQAWFAERLASDEGVKARAYLSTRGFDADTMQRFGFGYAPEGRQALKAALSQFPEAMLIEAGLRIAVEGKEPYDRFRGRLTIPIHDARGRVIGFAARILDATKTEAPKYINSPDTPLFDKGRTLFNLHRAGPVSRQSKRLVVVEGQMDVIALADAGIEDAVAPMGTALTEHQIELLWRLVEVPVLCFDGDAAGQRAAIKAAIRALPILRPDRSLAFVTMPAGMDPDDMMHRSGAAGMEGLLSRQQSLVDVLWRYEASAGPLSTPESKAGLKARLLTHADSIVDREIKSLYRRDLLERFSAFAYPPRGLTQKSPQGPLSQIIPGKSPSQGLVQIVVTGLARFPHFAATHAPALSGIATNHQEVAAALDAIDAGQPVSEAGKSAVQITPTVTGQAITMLYEMEALESALSKATNDLAENMTDATWVEQQRLIARKANIMRELCLNSMATQPK